MSWRLNRLILDQIKAKSDFVKTIDFSKEKIEEIFKDKYGISELIY